MVTNLGEQMRRRRDRESELEGGGRRERRGKGKILEKGGHSSEWRVRGEEDKTLSRVML